MPTSGIPYLGKEHRLDSLGQALVKVPEHMASKDEKEDGEVEVEAIDDRCTWLDCAAIRQNHERKSNDVCQTTMGCEDMVRKRRRNAERKSTKLNKKAESNVSMCAIMLLVPSRWLRLGQYLSAKSHVLLYCLQKVALSLVEPVLSNSLYKLQ